MEDCPLCGTSCPVRTWIENVASTFGALPQRTERNIFICHDCLVQWEPRRDLITPYGHSPLRPTRAEIQGRLPIDSPLVVG